jgi:tetratricopeptide (TPR) repeat protein
MTAWAHRGFWGAALQFCVLSFAFCVVSFRLVQGEAPSSAAQHYQTGLAYERLGRYEEAYTELQLAFALDPDNTSGAVALGVVASRLGRFDIAQRTLERSVALDANSVASYYHLALLYEKKGMTDRALDAWHRFVSLSQDEQLKTVAQKHIQHLENP